DVFRRVPFASSSLTKTSALELSLTKISRLPSALPLGNARNPGQCVSRLGLRPPLPVCGSSLTSQRFPSNWSPALVDSLREQKMRPSCDHQRPPANFVSDKMNVGWPPFRLRLSM